MTGTHFLIILAGVCAGVALQIARQPLWMQLLATITVITVGCWVFL